LPVATGGRHEYSDIREIKQAHDWKPNHRNGRILCVAIFARLEKNEKTKIFVLIKNI